MTTTTVSSLFDSVCDAVCEVVDVVVSKVLTVWDMVKTFFTKTRIGQHGIVGAVVFAAMAIFEVVLVILSVVFGGATLTVSVWMAAYICLHYIAVMAFYGLIWGLLLGAAIMVIEYVLKVSLSY